ncbi:MAG TPA: TIM44-like domain-containing protein [Kofleriaceae bacterium]|nr:TIM44-like domain-containing protein [Kofleriaceae bacterium]
MAAPTPRAHPRICLHPADEPPPAGVAAASRPRTSWARRRTRFPRRPRIRAIVALIAIVALLMIAGFPGLAVARPGGGDSFSGGGGHGGGSSGGGGNGSGIFELAYWLIRIVFAYPAIGLPLLALIIGYVLVNAYRQHQNKDWDSGPPAALQPAIDLTAVTRLDPAFSQIVFEDFAFRLFSTAHRARHTAEALATIAPYIAPEARRSLVSREPIGEPVVQVIAGALRTYRVLVPDAASGPPGRPRRVQIGIEYEANIATAGHTYYTVERWLFGRDAMARSKPPGPARTFPCPNCGAPWQAAHSGTQVCASCGQAVDNGRFDWVVEQISLISSDERPPTLTTEVPERGTELPTYREPDVDAAWTRLTRSDPQLTDAALHARLEMIYAQLHLAWANNDLRPVRGLVSDGLYDTLQYWTSAYQRQGLRNVLAGMRITRTALAKVTRDRYYDAVTIRLWGTGRDYVIREPGGARVRGSLHRDRAYSEYWTLIRTANRKGTPVASPTCSHCGAPLQIAQSGECEHCGAHLTSGEFDWVVSKIEQDDTYRG